MQTAEEIFESKRYYNKWMEELNDYEKLLIIETIKEAQKEAIEEAYKAVIHLVGDEWNKDSIRQSAQKLIDQIK